MDVSFLPLPLVVVALPCRENQRYEGFFGKLNCFLLLPAPSLSLSSHLFKLSSRKELSDERQWTWKWRDERRQQLEGFHLQRHQPSRLHSHRPPRWPPPFPFPFLLSTTRSGHALALSLSLSSHLLIGVISFYLRLGLDSWPEKRIPELFVECALYIDGAPFGLPTRTRFFISSLQ